MSTAVASVRIPRLLSRRAEAARFVQDCTGIVRYCSRRPGTGNGGGLDESACGAAARRLRRAQVSTDFIWSLDGRQVLLALVVLFALAAEVGFRGGRRHARRVSDREPQVGAIQGAVL